MKSIRGECILYTISDSLETKNIIIKVNCRQSRSISQANLSLLKKKKIEHVYYMPIKLN